MTILNPRPAFDPNEERPERIAQRAKCAAINTPIEYAADDPSRQTNNPPPSATSDNTKDALWRFARGAR